MAKKLNNTTNKKIILEIFQNSDKPLIVEEISKKMFEKYKFEIEKLSENLRKEILK